MSVVSAPVELQIMDSLRWIVMAVKDITISSVVLILQYLLNSFLIVLSKVTYLFSITEFIAVWIYSSVFALVRWGFKLISTVVYLFFQPFDLLVRIIEYNLTSFTNFWLGIFFNTSIDAIFNVDNGRQVFRIASKWIKFLNVMLLTGIFTGIFTYYTTIRIIYWMTIANGAKEEELRVLKGEHAKKLVQTRAEFTDATVPNERSLLEDFLLEEQFKDSGRVINRFDKQRSRNDSRRYSIEELDDDLVDYGSLSSLNTPQKEKFRSVSDSSTNTDTIKSTGLFSNMEDISPITTIHEDEEDDSFK